MNALDLSNVMLAASLVVPLTGVGMAVLPYVQRRGEVFAVTVPASAQDDPFVKRLKLSYALIMTVLTLAFTAVSLACASSGDSVAAMAAMVGGSLALGVGGYALMLAFRSRMRRLKRERGWRAEACVSVAVVGEPDGAPRAISMRWNLLYVPVIAVTLLVGVAGFDGMPNMLPMHVGLSGDVDRWVPKGPGVVAFPVVVQVFAVLCLVLCHWSILRSKRSTDPGSPASSAWAYGMFARAQSVLLLVSGLVLVGVTGLAFQLSSIGAVTLAQASVLVLLAALGATAGSIVLSVVYGQAGSRVFRRMQSSDVLLADDDEHWKLGVFYWNPADASMFLPERFGVGWTANWARPAVWVLAIGCVAVAGAFVALALHLA